MTGCKYWKEFQAAGGFKVVQFGDINIFGNLSNVSSEWLKLLLEHTIYTDVGW